MNKTEIINRITERTEINREECEIIINTFEKVLEEELSDSKGIKEAFNKVYNVLHYFREKKDENNNKQ